MSTATLSGRIVTSCTVALPAWGVWWADVEADSEDDALTGAVALDVAGLELSGTIMSGGEWQGRARYRIAGGAGRWGAQLGARSYANDLGVKRRRVLSDAAQDCGERLEAEGITGTLGPQWARDAGPASRVLHLVAPRAWYVGEDGTTRIGARPIVDYEGEATIVHADRSESRVVLAADDLRGLVPGVTVDGVTAVDVVHEIRGGALRSTLWGERGSGSRVPRAFARAVESVMAWARYRGVWSYRVVSQHGERLDLQAERASAGMPDLQLVRVRPGVPGWRASHALGSMVLVAFVDGDPSRPVVIAGDDADSPGHVPAALAADAGTTIGLADAIGPVVCYGDLVTVGAETGVIAHTPTFHRTVPARVLA
jgi:hypothetical protein